MSVWINELSVISFLFLFFIFVDDFNLLSAKFGMFYILFTGNMEEKKIKLCFFLYFQNFFVDWMMK